MVVNKLGVNALLPMLCRLRFSKSFTSDNHVCCDLNNSTLDFLSSFIEIVFKVSSQSRKSEFRVFSIVRLNG